MLWAACAGWGSPSASYRCRPIQPYIGRYDETALRRIDLILSEARNNDLKIIMALSNFEPDLGGRAQTVVRVCLLMLGSGSSKTP